MSMGGGERTVVQQSATPQLLPEGAEGYKQANQYFRDFLSQPAVYSGTRVAPTAPLQAQGYNVAGTLAQPSAPIAAAGNEVQRTLGGDWMSGPAAQSAVASLAAPIFQQFYQSVLPGIRDRAQFAGQGVGSTRRGVAEASAIDELGRGLATGVVAPIFSGERDRMIQAIGQAPKLQQADTERALTLSSIGGQQQAQAQNEIDAIRAAFEEPIFRQSGAASALSAMGGMVTPGSSTSTSTGSQSNPLGAVSSLAQLGALAKMMSRA